MAEGTTYTIDIQAAVDGGDQSVDTLLALADQLTAVTKLSTSFDAAIARTASALDAAKTATAATTAALTEAEAGYVQLEKAAVRAWREAEKAGQKGDVPPKLVANLAAAKAALDAEGAALDALAVKASAAAAAESKLADNLKKLESGAKAETKEMSAAAEAIGKAMAALSKAPAQLKPIPVVLDKIKVPARNIGESLEKVSGVLNRFGGSAGGVAAQGTNAVGSLAKLSTIIGGVAASALAAVAVVGLLTAGLVAGAAAALRYGITMADAGRSAGLQTEAIEQTSGSLAGLSEILPDVQRATELARGDIEGLGKDLSAAKVSAANMPAALKAVATAEAALGKGGAAKFIEDLKTGKKTVAEVAAEVDSKFGGIVAKKLLGLDAQSTRLQRNFGEIFGGLKIEGFLEGLSKIVDLFDAQTESGKTLKFLFETIFQPFIDGSADAFVVVEAFILGVEIGALKMYIAFKTVYNSVRDLLGISSEGSSSFDWLEAAELAGQLLVGTLFGIATVIGVVVAAAVGLASIPIILGELVGKAIAIGVDMIGGLVQGIISAGPRVLEAITGAVSGAIDAAKNLLKINSPSLVFADMGESVSEGFGKGIDDAAPIATSALESLVAPPDVAANTNTTNVSTSRSSGGLTVNFNGPVSKDDGDWIVEKIRSVLTDTYETDALQAGAA